MPAKARSHCLRKGRFSHTGQVYLVTTRLVPGRKTFEHWRLGRLVVAELRRAHELGTVVSIAWVVMPDHLHWLFELREDPLERIMQCVKSRSAIALNKATGGAGRVWQTGYHDIALRREDDLKHLARYVLANPLRAGLVETIRDYPLRDCKWI